MERGSTTVLRDLRELSPLLNLSGRSNWEVNVRVTRLKTLHGLSVWTGERDIVDAKDLYFKGLEASQAVDALDLLEEEIAKYPPGFLQDIRLGRFRLVNNLYMRRGLRFVSGGKVEVVRQRIGGFAKETGQLYIDYAAHDLHYTRDTVHHELLHQGDDMEAEALSSDRNTKSLVLDSYEQYWVEQNLGGRSRYIGSTYWDIPVNDPTRDDLVGFDRFYGRCSWEEDRATIAGSLMANTIEIFERVLRDEVLSGKLSWVMSDFWRRSRGRMDQRYFDDLANDKVKIGYWDRARGKKYAVS